MIEKDTLNVGDKVRYQPEHYADNEWENGLVKRILPGEDAAFVVYNCAGNWHKFQEYTAARTNLRDLKRGWRITNLRDLRWRTNNAKDII